MITEAKRSRVSKHYQRLSVHDVNDVIATAQQKASFVYRNPINNGQFLQINLSSIRYQVFVTSGTSCVSCGITASYFAIEKDRKAGSYHMNMYAVNNGGVEVLMTRDHIKPRSKGGKNTLANQQTMCTYCNRKKGSNYEQHKPRVAKSGKGSGLISRDAKVQILPFGPICTL